MSRLFRAQLGSSNRKSVAVRLADFADDDGKGIWPSVARVAYETELSDRTVQRILREFVDEGLLVVVKNASGRPGEATRYDFNMAVLDRFLVEKKRVDGCHHVTGDTVSPVQTGDTECETGDTECIDGCHGVTRTVIEPLVKPLGEREARESGEGENPKSVERAFKVWHPTWPTFADDKDDKVLAAWRALTAEERVEATARSAAYVAAVKATGRKYTCGADKYLSEKRWLKLDALETSKVTSVAKAAGGGKAVSPDGFVASFSPPHAAKYFLLLLAGPDKPDLAPSNGLWFARNLRDAWPRMAAFWQQSDLRQGLVISSKVAALAENMEFVKVDSPVLAQWHQLFREKGWPSLRLMAAGGYLPKGGPQGLDEFERAARALFSQGVSDDAA
jgi:Helix-turn-helix domain